MPDLTITQRQARRYILAHQALWPPYELQGKSGILSYIRRVGCIQFDPLDIVGQNPELVLQARVADFRPNMLTQLLYEDRKLVDGWDKNMSIYPVEDWPYFRRNRAKARQHPGKSPEAVRAALPQVRKALEDAGPLSSIDLELDRKVKWSWAPTRLARATLQSMYNWGELIVHHKVHTRKVYDFAAKYIPAEILEAPEPNPTESEYHDWYVLRRIGSVGLLWNRATSAWLGMGKIKSKERTAALARLQKRGEVIPVRIEGLKPRFYLRRSDEPRFRAVLAQDADAEPSYRAAIIAPLDNLIWDRRLALELFGFEYVWEVYKPAAERRYGYYVLPILYGDRFIARFEPSRETDDDVLRIEHWWWEPNVERTETMLTALREGFQRFLAYLNADTLQITERAREQAGLDWLSPN
jgi:uncharacterized protein YcaQ